MKYFIKEQYYFDIDKNQLRIAGPANHLFLGLTLPTDTKIEIDKYKIAGKQLEIDLSLDKKSIEFTIPAVTDIRTIRSYTEPVTPKPTFEELVRSDIEEIIPEIAENYTIADRKFLKFVKKYIDSLGKTRKYGSLMTFAKSCNVTLENKLVSVTCPKNIKFRIRTISNILISEILQKPIFGSVENLPAHLFSPHLLTIYEEAEKNINFLIRTKKTSSYEYGTIFPRDWIESADLGFGDLSENTIDYMYLQSLKHVSEKGEGWHEDVIGGFVPSEKNLIDRKMIDIEPHYIMGMEIVSKSFLTRRKNQKRLRLISDFIIQNAKDKELITFKLKNNEGNEFHIVGNWRDSSEAYPNQESPLAPYDVNCIFYPVSLKIIRKFNHFFRIKKTQELDELIEKWDQNKKKFRTFYGRNSIMGYALALHGKEQKKLKTPHLDESYDLFYGDPSMEEVVNFSDKISSPKYFYTPVGPLLVASKSKLFTKKNYHGKVIWPKQAAFAVAGLTRQYKRGIGEGWPLFVLNNIKKSIIKTSRACFKGWTDLGTVPELYYYDKNLDKARYFTDQENYVGQMSLIQLWSSIAARRIMKDYSFIISEK